MSLLTLRSHLKYPCLRVHHNGHTIFRKMAAICLLGICENVKASLSLTVSNGISQIQPEEHESSHVPTSCLGTNKLPSL